MRRAVTVALPLAVVLVLSIWRAQGPPPRDAHAPADTFSATRAMSVLRELLAEGIPHPVGSPANARIRQRIESRFRALGYDTAVQRRFACNGNAQCATVENIIVHDPNAPAGDTILLVAHYDSVPAGPGASDDGMGVATLLEVARAIRSHKMVNRVAFLLTDGEEAGLLGAEAFVADETLLRDVDVVINFEMRGTHGASNLFETSKGNRWLIRHLARTLPRPQASSFFYTIYSLLPNDTDVTVFKRAGKAAVNFAAIGGVNWYHTPLDDLVHASPRTLQHHGDHALATLRALGAADLAARSRTDATYFDVLQFFVIWWPQEWTLWIAIISLIALLFAVRKTPPRSMTFGVLSTFTALLFAGAGGMAMSWLVRLRSMDVNWVARPLAGILALAFTGLAAALFAAALLDRRKDARGMLYGVAIVWHAIAIALAIALPGTAYLMLMPALAVTICALAKASEATTSIVAATVAAIVIFPIGIMIYEALGGGLMAVIALIAGTHATLIAPLFARARNGVAAIALAIVCAIVALLQPSFTREKPDVIPLYYVDDSGAGKPQWITYTVTPALANVAKFTRADAKLTPWNRGGGWVAPAPDLRLRRITVSGERNGSALTIRAASHRNAGRISLFVRGGTIRRTNGVTPPPITRHRSQLANGWQVTNASGVEELIVDVEATGPVEVIASDSTFAFPSEGAALLRARDASNAMTIQDGDVTITRTRATF
ncbi:MAG TPA: M20/M25/M40 family metallo-hydrolase [Thermoanaerobaculia bacterium]|nr:M20/M25/M40 family metallo-hydrolase [Thermoanaerobaculia bacterium]